MANLHIYQNDDAYNANDLVIRYTAEPAEFSDSGKCLSIGSAMFWNMKNISGSKSYCTV